MRVLIDTNVVLDFLQERQPFVEAARLFARIDTGEIEGFIAATTMTNTGLTPTSVGMAVSGTNSIATTRLPP